MRSLRRLSLFACVISVASLAGGCRLGELFNGKSVATVKFFGTHAGTPDAAGFPNYGPAESARVFVNDMGWTVSLGEVYVTTTAVHLIRCGSEQGTPIEMFWGPCAEDFIVSNDRESLALGAVTVDDGSFCGVEVHFSPYIEDEELDDHVVPDNPEVAGKTIFINGTARRPLADGEEEVVPFQVVSEQQVVARLDISEIDGGDPLELDDEQFPVDLTILKTYDSFFAGVDFATAGPADLEATVLAALELDTRPYMGAVVAE